MSGRLILACSAEKTAAVYYFSEVMLMGVTQCSPAPQASFHKFDCVHSWPCSCNFACTLFSCIGMLTSKTLMGSKIDGTTVQMCAQTTKVKLFIMLLLFVKILFSQNFYIKTDIYMLALNITDFYIWLPNSIRGT